MYKWRRWGMPALRVRIDVYAAREDVVEIMARAHEPDWSVRGVKEQVRLYAMNHGTDWYFDDPVDTTYAETRLSALGL